MIAGFNVARLGVLSYLNIERTWYLYFFISCIYEFGLMFFKMSQKHTKRILGYEEYRPFWHFFDFKAYLIMICMMSGGIDFVQQVYFQRYLLHFLFWIRLGFSFGGNYFYKKLFII